MDFFFDGGHFSIREEYLLAAAAVASISLLCGMAGAWIGSYWGARRGGRKAMLKAMASPVQTKDALQTEQLARSVDAMALEVERISEAQRFLVKLLSEREAAQLPVQRAAPSPRSGSVTPH
jgi:hypothetical protein